ncbi:impB/mucB/samB family [Carpediemonas membranifera]|uniref:ImpB/mucB/samB family n=1 Tax=Carpediemonas membranifera TaxID=201153 RepID=A0A8J6BBV6_9EUKA|nr:impB/mucB/samB family [Carpediemonas membranifera]|eukprot:KAG9397544.1 impB/mucB/samB family [Carpediemonas membranifera]
MTCVVEQLQRYTPSQHTPPAAIRPLTTPTAPPASYTPVPDTPYSIGAMVPAPLLQSSYYAVSVRTAMVSAALQTYSSLEGQPVAVYSRDAILDANPAAIALGATPSAPMPMHHIPKGLKLVPAHFESLRVASARVSRVLNRLAMGRVSDVGLFRYRLKLSSSREDGESIQESIKRCVADLGYEVDIEPVDVSYASNGPIFLDLANSAETNAQILVESIISQSTHTGKIPATLRSSLAAVHIPDKVRLAIHRAARLYWSAALDSLTQRAAAALAPSVAALGSESEVLLDNWSTPPPLKTGLTQYLKVTTPDLHALADLPGVPLPDTPSEVPGSTRSAAARKAKERGDAMRTVRLLMSQSPTQMPEKTQNLPEFTRPPLLRKVPAPHVRRRLETQTAAMALDMADMAESTESDSPSDSSESASELSDPAVEIEVGESPASSSGRQVTLVDSDIEIEEFIYQPSEEYEYSSLASASDGGGDGAALVPRPSVRLLSVHHYPGRLSGRVRCQLCGALVLYTQRSLARHVKLHRASSVLPLGNKMRLFQST